MFLLTLLSSAFSTKPNILFIIADDLGSNDLEPHGAEYKTPNLDRIFKEGLDFSNYYVQASCSPTRSSLMTGRYPFRLGMQSLTTIPPGTQTHIPDDEPTWAEQLKELGYSNYYLGKWHLGYAKWAYTPLGKGWDYYTGLLQGGGDYYNHTLAVPKQLAPKLPPSALSGIFDFWLNREPDLASIGRHTNDVILERALGLLDKEAAKETSEPFSMTLAFQEVHAPNEDPTKDRIGATAHCDSNDAIVNERRRTYCKQASVLDDSIGQVIAKLEDLGLYDNTLIVFTTDNGGMTWNSFFQAPITESIGSNYPRRAGKATDFEGGVHGVAAIFGGALPEHLKGKTDTNLHHAVDLPVTIMTAAGATIPPKVDGKDILAGESHEGIYIDINAWSPMFKHNAHAIRWGDMKYLHNIPTYDGWFKLGYEREAPNEAAGLNNCTHGCLFNLTADPYERKNLEDRHHIPEWLKLNAYIDEVIVGGDFKAFQSGFFKINVTAFNLTYQGHPIYYPYLEEMPAEANNLGARHRPSDPEEEVFELGDAHQSVLEWFISAL